MAKRIGKYKISKKESNLSILNESVVATDKVFLTGLSSPTSTASLAENQLFRTGSDFLTQSNAEGHYKNFDVVCIRNADGSRGGNTIAI